MRKIKDYPSVLRQVLLGASLEVTFDNGRTRIFHRIK